MWNVYKRKTGSILLYCFFALVMILALQSKKNWYVDEVCSYGLANNVSGTCIPIEDGITYYPSNVPWIDYMSVDSENRFNYANVWENQASDVHPPLYYMILHTVCSLFTDSVSIWFAGLINVVFALGTLFFLRKIVLLLTENELLTGLISVMFVCSAGILSAVTFLRMYILAMFWITALTYLIIKQIGEGQNALKYTLCTMFISMGGALTHYYCIVYIIFISIAYGCYLLYSRNWKGTGFFCLAQGIAALASIGIFPTMLEHILSSSRGHEAVNNIVDNSWKAGFERLQIFFNMIDSQLFGGVFIYIFFSFLLFLILMRKNALKMMSEKRIMVIRYICVGVPIVLYFILISKIAAYMTDRYMFPIYAVLYAVVLSGISECFRVLQIQHAVYMFAILTVIMSVNSWKDMNWTYLYKESETLLETASNYADVDCLYVYEKPWEINPSYYEVSQYHSVTFLKRNELDLLVGHEISDKYHLIVMTTGDDDEVLKQVMDVSPYLNAYDYVGGYGYTNTYYMHGLQ